MEQVSSPRGASTSGESIMARIYQTTVMGEAGIRIAIVGSRGEADLLVHRVGSWGLAHGDARWYITRDKQDATALVFFTSIGFSQLKVCFVDTLGEAGWQRPSRFRGRLG
jgi:hypothetical protein